jgi:putative phosphonate catabolism associated alcohol dehydrogenase
VIRAHVFHGADQPGQWQEFPTPTPGAGELLVRIELAAICGSDLHTLAGTRREPTPCILGHEGVGTVVAAAPDATASLGQRVTWTLADSCGTCRTCTRNQLPQKCTQLFKYGHASLSDGTGLNGTYATHILLRPGTTVVPLPDEVSNEVAVAANCALATMVATVRALRRHHSPVESVVIQGAGLLGVYAAALLTEAGVPTVLCTDLDPARLEIAAAFGAVPILATSFDATIAAVRTHVPDGVDAVIEAAGVRQLLNEGVEMLRPGGWYGWVGLVHPDSVIGPTAEQIIRRSLTVCGIHNYAPSDLREAVDFLKRTVDRFPYERLMSPPMPLEDLDLAAARARDREFMRITLGPAAVRA